MIKLNGYQDTSVININYGLIQISVFCDYSLQYSLFYKGGQIVIYRIASISFKWCLQLMDGGIKAPALFLPTTLS